MNNRKSIDSGQEQHGLHALFYPRAVAVIGASTNPLKFGGLPINYCLQRNFEIPLAPVNPNAEFVQGLQAYSSLEEVPYPVDCAVVSVPSKAVLGALKSCAAKGVKSALIFSAGFSEAGEEGVRMQEEAVALAESAGMRLLGPNCLGAFNLDNNFIATFTNAFENAGKSSNQAGFPNMGEVGIASQSGAVGSFIMVRLRERGIGIAKWITTGNQCDIDVADCIEYYALDPSVKVIVAYLEGCPDGPALMRALAAAQKAGKPVLMLKVGTSDAGAKAVASHTASLAGEDRVYSAVFDRFGVCRVDSVGEIVDVAAACIGQKNYAVPQVAAITTSGGIGVMMADAAQAYQVAMPEMSDSLYAPLKEVAPVAIGNPLDAASAGMTNMSVISSLGRVLLSSGEYNALLIFLNHLGLVPRMIEAMLPHLLELRKDHPDAVIYLCLITDEERRRELEGYGFLVIEDPDRAIRSFAHLGRIAKCMNHSSDTVLPRDVIDSVPQALQAGRVLSEHESKQLLRQYDFPLVDDYLATSEKSAAEAAAKFGFPVAMKLVSPDVLHKSDIGCVILDVPDEQSARQGYQQILANARNKAPTSQIDGVLVSPMIQGGTELILGMQQDPVFGPVIMIGFGGVLVEILEDVIFVLPPVNKELARSIIESLKGFPILQGARGAPELDIDAAACAIESFSALVCGCGMAIESVDINPLVLLPKGQGVVAVDALITPAVGK